MTTLSVVVERDAGRGVTVVATAGALTPDSHGRLYDAVAAALADLPYTVIVNLAATTVADAPLMVGLRPLNDAAAREPGVGLVWCVPAPGVARLLRGHAGALAVCGGLEQANLLVPRGAAAPWVSARLPPEPESASLARLLVGDACLRWGLPGLLDPVRAVVTELVANAIEHAPGELTVTAALRAPQVVVAVHDGSPVEPRLSTVSARRLAPGARGRGLHLVSAFAAAWGTVRKAAGGKAVWASLRAPADVAGPGRPGPGDDSDRPTAR
ncbi:MAG TPA: ATP-binding protein [Pilimelia sp.]|nr:ATP-binding protein [Pilimelia sp.]